MKAGSGIGCSSPPLSPSFLPFAHSPHRHEPGPSTSSGADAIKVGTVCLVGLSGPEREKGALGVGKSTLCNRMVRPNFVDFSTEHISCLSQADFLCSPVINAEHWLYWGELDLRKVVGGGGAGMPSEGGASGRRRGRGISHLRVLEQTIFVDDEGFEPLGTALRRDKVAEDYARRALGTRLESPGKIAYQKIDQLGQESDFARQQLPDAGQTAVDAFCVLFDVSAVPGRSLQHQCAVVSALLLGAVRTKKPVFLVATKFDECSAEGRAEWQKLLARKELKAAAQNIQTVEVSAVENVNVDQLLLAIADSLGKSQKSSSAAAVADHRHHHHPVSSYSDAFRARRNQREQIRTSFRALLDAALPREEYLLHKGEASWSRLLANNNVAMEPAYVRFVNEFGPGAAKAAFEEHLRYSREWWFEHELSVRLPSLRDVLRRMFPRLRLCQARWSQLVRDIEAHPEFDTFFQPLGRSLDRLSGTNEQWDERLPGEMLQKQESAQLFAELQRELLDEIALERQADKFRALLAQKEAAITPGRSFRDAKVMLDELGAFEAVLPPGTALRIYEQYQEEIVQRALRDFWELLQEQIDLFVDIVVQWRGGHPELPPMIGLDVGQSEAVDSILREDKRYRWLNGLPEVRAAAIGQFASFLSLPLERHCPGGALCADLGASLLLQRHIQHSSSPFYTIELAMHGPARLCHQLLKAIQCHTGSGRMFAHNGLSVRFITAQHTSPSSSSSASSSSAPSPSHPHFCCPSPASSSASPSSPSLSARIASQLFLFSTPEEAAQHLMDTAQTHPGQHQLISRPSVGGLCPLVLQLGHIAAMDSNNGQFLQQIGNQLADQLGGMFALLPFFAHSPNGGEQEEEENGHNDIDHSDEDADLTFSHDHLDWLLHELCALQFDSGHSDLRVRVSSMCGDSYSLESVLSPLLDHSHLPIDHSGRKFWLDAHLPVENEAAESSMTSGDIDESSPRKETAASSPSPSLLAQHHRLLSHHQSHRCKARVCLSIGSFHHWLLAKWPLQSVQGHLLIFSPARRASWRHARCAAKLLLDSVGTAPAREGGRHGAGEAEEEEEEEEEEDPERRAMGRSIFLLAVSEPNAFFRDKRAARILTKAERFATRIGALFASFGCTAGKMPIVQSQCFLEFFQRILQNPFPPADYYTITSRRRIGGGDDWHSIAQSQWGGGICSTLTGSAETLMTEGNGEEEGEEAEDGANCWEGAAAAANHHPMAQNALWRRKSKQSRIALVGSPPPPPKHPIGGRKRMPPPVLRNDSQLSAGTQWTCASALTASTLTEGRAAMAHRRGLGMNGSGSRHGSDSTTRTPMAAASSGDGEEHRRRTMMAQRQERPRSAVILPSTFAAAPMPFADEEEAQREGRITESGSKKTPRRLEKLLSSFVQLRSTTPVRPLRDDTSMAMADGPMGTGPPVAGSRRSRMMAQKMASMEEGQKPAGNHVLHRFAAQFHPRFRHIEPALWRSMDSLLFILPPPSHHSLSSAQNSTLNSPTSSGGTGPLIVRQEDEEEEGRWRRQNEVEVNGKKKDENWKIEEEGKAWMRREMEEEDAEEDEERAKREWKRQSEDEEKEEEEGKAWRRKAWRWRGRGEKEEGKAWRRKETGEDEEEGKAWKRKEMEEEDAEEDEKKVKREWKRQSEDEEKEDEGKTLMTREMEEDEENTKWEWKRHQQEEGKKKTWMGRRRSRSELPAGWARKRGAGKEGFGGKGEEREEEQGGILAATHQQAFFVRRILPSSWRRQRKMVPSTKRGKMPTSASLLLTHHQKWPQAEEGMANARIMLESGKISPPPSPQPPPPPSSGPFAWFRSPRSQSRSAPKAAPISPSGTSQQSASSDASAKTGGSAESGGGGMGQKEQQAGGKCGGWPPLGQQCAQSPDGMPPFLVNCVRTIEQNGGLETEGLYRVPGNQMDVERMFQQQQRRRRHKREGDGQWDFRKIPVHAVATGLKRFLDGLPEAVIPEPAHPAILTAVESAMDRGSRRTMAVEEIGQILEVCRCNLPSANWRVLCFLAAHLRRVAERAAANSMDLRNLAKVWTPTLFRPNFDSFEAMASFMAKFEMATLVLLANCGGGQREEDDDEAAHHCGPF